MKRILSVVLSLTIVFAALVACSNGYGDQFESAEKIAMTLPGHKAKDMPFEMNAVYYGNDYVEFYADENISKSALNKTVTYTMQILDELKPTTKITCYVSRNLPTVIGYESNVMYLSVLSVKTLDHLINTVTVALQGKVPYGLVYGIAQRINKKYNWGIKFDSSVTDAELTEYLKSNPDRVELQAPDFYEETGVNVNAAKAAALAFASFVEAQESDLFAFCKSLDFGDERLRQYISDWANTLGVPSGEGLPCAFSFIDGNINEIIIRSALADMSIPVTFDDYIHSYYAKNYPDIYKYDVDYSGLKPYLIPVFNDLSKYDVALRDLQLVQREKPIIHFSDANASNSLSNVCYVVGIRYVHMIYLSYRYSINRGFEKIVFEEASMNHIIYKYSESELMWLREYDKYIAEPRSEVYDKCISLMEQKYPESVDYEISYYEHIKMYNHAYAYVMLRENGTYDPLPPDSWMDYSFVSYLIELTDFPTFDCLRFGADWEGLFGKTLNELKEDWKSYIYSLWED